MTLKVVFLSIFTIVAVLGYSNLYASKLREKFRDLRVKCQVSTEHQSIQTVKIPVLEWNVESECQLMIQNNYADIYNYLRSPSYDYLKSSQECKVISQTDEYVWLEATPLNFLGSLIKPTFKYDIINDIKDNHYQINLILKEALFDNKKSVQLLDKDMIKINSQSLITLNFINDNISCISTKLSLQINLTLPPNFQSKFPLSIIQSSGNYMIQNYVNSIVAASLRDIVEDYNNKRLIIIQQETMNTLNSLLD